MDRTERRRRGNGPALWLCRAREQPRVLPCFKEHTGVCFVLARSGLPAPRPLPPRPPPPLLRPAATAAAAAASVCLVPRGRRLAERLPTVPCRGGCAARRRRRRLDLPCRLASFLLRGPHACPITPLPSRATPGFAYNHAIFTSLLHLQCARAPKTHAATPCRACRERGLWSRAASSRPLGEAEAGELLLVSCGPGGPQTSARAHERTCARVQCGALRAAAGAIAGGGGRGALMETRRRAVVCFTKLLVLCRPLALKRDPWCASARAAMCSRRSTPGDPDRCFAGCSMTRAAGGLLSCSPLSLCAHIPTLHTACTHQCTEWRPRILGKAA